MKNIINWSYGRGSWQYEILCLLILAFIFLTPKSWFVTVATFATQTAAVVVEQGDCGCDVPQ
jgi:hypothetical protein